MNTHLIKKHPEKLDQSEETVDDTFVSVNHFISLFRNSGVFSRKLQKGTPEMDDCLRSAIHCSRTTGFRGHGENVESGSNIIFRQDYASRSNICIQPQGQIERNSRKNFNNNGWLDFQKFSSTSCDQSRAHWLDNEWDYQSQLLDFCHIEGSHSGKNFRDLFAQALQSLEIPLDKIISVTVDNASSNDTFFDELEKIFDILGDDQHIRCLAHIINLAAQNVLKSLKHYTTNLDKEHPVEDELVDEILDDIDLDFEIQDDGRFEWINNENDADTKIVVKLRTLVRKIRKSVLMRQKLSKLCTVYSVKYLVPILDVSTRWNSTYEMIIRAEHLRTPLKVLCANEKSLTSLSITDREWLDLLEIKHRLQKFHRATQLVSMERHSTIHAYLPTLDWLIVSIKGISRGPASTLAHAAELGLKKLQKYYEIIYDSKIPYIATFLNPALKINSFKEHKYPNYKVREIKNMISAFFSDNYDNNEVELEEKENAEDEVDELYAHMYKRSKVDQISTEIQKYLNLPLEPPKTSPLEYWR